MKILYFGDVVGRAGRDALLKELPKIKDLLKPDVIIVNGENAAHGFGINSKICNQFFDADIDVITMGNHVWDQREIIPFFSKENRIIRPANLHRNTPGKGSYEHTTEKGKKILVAQVAGRLFMDSAADPFAAVDDILKSYLLGRNIDAIVVDFHAETTSEKNALGHYLDSRVSLVVGSHTHIPTADARVLTGGSAYITDAGMCGDYNSVIGMKKEGAVHRFTSDLPGERLSPANGKGTISGVFVETDDKTGLAIDISMVSNGGRIFKGIL